MVEDARRQEIRLGKRPADEISPAIGAGLPVGLGAASQSSWPLLGRGILDEDDSSSDAWPHMDPDFLSRLFGPSSWVPLSAMDSSALTRYVSFVPVGDIPTSGFGNYEVGSSSPLDVDQLAAGESIIDLHDIIGCQPLVRFVVRLRGAVLAYMLRACRSKTGPS